MLLLTREEEARGEGLAAGHAKGLEEGHAKGLEEGISIGEKRGRENMIRTVMERLLARGMSYDEAADILGLTNT